MGFFGFMFDPDNTFGRAMNYIGKIVISNFLFLLCSLPIITIGASYTALCYVMLKLEKGDEVSVPTEFIHSFRSNFRQTTIGWMIGVVVLIIGYISVGICMQMESFGTYLQYTILIVMVILVAYLLYLFPTIAAFENTLTSLSKNAIYFMGSHPMTALTVGAIQIIPMMLMFLDERNQPTYVFCFFFFGFALLTRIAMKMLLKIFMPYLAAAES